MVGIKGMFRPPSIIDEFTFREDLTHSQKYKLRYPEKYKVIKEEDQRKAREKWASSSTKIKREKWLKTKYKISFEEYEKMYLEQQGKCDICEIHISITTNKNGHSTACVDHNHSTGKIRGLLCNHCNRAIGLLKESIQNAKNLLNYMEKHS